MSECKHEWFKVYEDCQGDDVFGCHHCNAVGVFDCVDRSFTVIKPMVAQLVPDDDVPLIRKVQ